MKPPIVTRTQRVLVKAMRLLGLHGRMTAREKPGQPGRWEIVVRVDVPMRTADEPASLRAAKREFRIKRG